jgi:hypothetical protein
MKEATRPAASLSPPEIAKRCQVHILHNQRIDQTTDKMEKMESVMSSRFQRPSPSFDDVWLRLE